jgi:hypothetical protein
VRSVNVKTRPDRVEDAKKADERQRRDDLARASFSY